MNTNGGSSVQGFMGKYFTLGLVLLVGCGSAIDASGLGDDDEEVFDAEQPGGSDSALVGPDYVRGRWAGAVEESPRADTAPSDLSDTASIDTGSADIHSEVDSALGADGMGSDAGWDGGCGVSHHCPLGSFDYTSCTPKIYNEPLLDEQIAKTKEAASSSWIWSGVSTIQCDGGHGYPVSAGESCTRTTVTTPGGLFDAVWCRSGALAGRFRQSSDPVNVCPYGSDPVTWW